MGYRSDVKLILTDKGMSMLKAKLPEPKEDETLVWGLNEIYQAIKIDDNKYWLIEWHDIKWYDDAASEYEVPCAVLKLRNELREMDEPFQFMRVGEDYEDIEVERCYSKEPMPYLELKRKIEVEY